MSNINDVIIESLFRAKSDQSKFRPSVLAHQLIHKKLPDRNLVSNSSKVNKLYSNNKLYDSHLEPEWIDRLHSSPYVPDNFEISGGYDSNNVAFISFSTKITPKLQHILDKIKTFKNTHVEVNKKLLHSPLIIIAAPIYFTDQEPEYSEWVNWFDSITSALSDNVN